MSDIIERLRSTPNWLRQTYGAWKTATCVYDHAPFDAATEIERLRAERTILARWIADVLPTLEVIDSVTECEDGGERSRMLIDSGHRLVEAVLSADKTTEQR